MNPMSDDWTFREWIENFGECPEHDKKEVGMVIDISGTDGQFSIYADGRRVAAGFQTCHDAVVWLRNRTDWWAEYSDETAVHVTQPTLL
jgi:hypothetical protein